MSWAPPCEKLGGKAGVSRTVGLETGNQYQIQGNI